MSQSSSPSVSPPPGHWLTSSDHKVVGQLLVLVGILGLAAAGVLAAVLRTQLAGPNLAVLGVARYDQLLTLHGVLGVFGFLLPVWVGLGTAIVPLQLGATRTAYPRLAAQSLWLFLAGGGLIVGSAFTPHSGAPTWGWDINPVVGGLRGADGRAADLALLGLAVLGAATVLGAINLVVTVLRLRAPGLTLRRVPLFSWSVLVSGLMLCLAVPVLIAGLVLLFVDRHYGGHAFDATLGGAPGAWNQLFWFFATPTLWAALLPSLGLVADVVATLARRPLWRRPAAFGAVGAVGTLAFFSWGAELAQPNRTARVLFALTSLAVLAAAAALLGTALVTLLQRPARPKLASPLLGALGLASVVGAGLAGRAVSAVGPNTRLGLDSAWALGARHELFFAGPALGLVIAAGWWAPKLWGRRLNEPLSVLSVLALVGGLHLANLALYILGGQGMGIHTVSYHGHPSWQAANVASTVGAYLTVLGVLAFLANLLRSAVAPGRSSEADGDPWQGDTLEWAAASPPPPHNFDSLPEIRSERPLADRRSADRRSTAGVG
ncbi:MAG: cbb3-type cytochrome c oxidase subunit I [Acidimicrobiales bacterium]